MQSDEISTKSSYIENISEIKLEPGDVHDLMVDVSEQIDNKSDSSELSKNVDNISENVLGSYQFKQL